MIKNNKIFFRTYDAFQSALQNNQISGDSIVFIENRGLVWTHGAFFGDVTDDLVNYCLKSETYTKAEVQALIDTVEKFTYRIVSELPTASADTMYIIYLVPSSESTALNIKDEYITIDNGEEAETRYTWELIGSTAVNMSGYYTSQQTEAAISTALADYTTTADLTTLLANKQDAISDLATIRSGASAGATAYQKPVGGIPVSDLSADAQQTKEHEYVDLGLPSGTLWATMNVGALSETERGDYYMYGKGARKYDETDSPYSGNENPLDISRDTARQVWGGDWHTPTKDQFDELLANTTVTFVYHPNGSDVNGCMFTATNGNYIFLPAAGYLYPDLTDDNRLGLYFSSTPVSSSSYVYGLRVSRAREIPAMSHGVVKDNLYRGVGMSIRPVKEGVTKEKLGLDKVGNFKAVSTEANQNLIDAEKSNAQLNMGLPHIVDVREDGFYLIDEYGYIGAQLTEDGFDAIGLENVGSGSTITITNY